MINKSLNKMLWETPAFVEAMKQVANDMPPAMEYKEGNQLNYENWIFFSGIRQGYRLCLKNLGMHDARIRELHRGATDS